MINQFIGNYRFLSNFWDASVSFEGLMYRNNEAAFQSAKLISINERKAFTNLNPSEAKKLGRRVNLRADWEAVKDDVMYQVCLDKFTRNPDLREKLLATGKEYLEEGNTWGDCTWGTVDGIGENRLGIILMRIRAKLLTEASKQ